MNLKTSIRSLAPVLICSVFGAIVSAQSEPSARELEAARRELLAAMPSASPDSAGRRRDGAAEAVRSRAALESLTPIDVTLALRGLDDAAGLSIRAWHQGLDLSVGPVRTDGRGRAVLRLPRGSWVVDVWDPDPRAGRAVFARERYEVSAAGARELRIDAKAIVTFRVRTGRVKNPDTVVLAPADVAVVARGSAVGGRLEVAMSRATRVTMLASRAFGADDGFIARRELAPGRHDVRVEGGDATEFKFDVKAPRQLVARFLSTDAVPLNLRTSTTRKRSMWLSGMAEIALGYDLELGPKKAAGVASFYRRPFVLDGQSRTFTGRPPFALSVGHRINSGRFFTKRFARSFRVFVRERNDMVLRGWSKNPYRVEWSMLRDGSERGQGEMQRDMRGIVTRNRLAGDGPFRYRLRLVGPVVDRREELAGHGQSAIARVGKVRVHSYPELLPNAELFARWCSRHVDAFDLTNGNRPPDVKVWWWTHQARGILGMGSWRNVWLTENKLAGFIGPHYWHWNVTHELAHAFGYNVHGAAHQAAMRRAATRFRTLDPGPARVAAGDRFRAVLTAIGNGAVTAMPRPTSPSEPMPVDAGAGSYEADAPDEPVESPAVSDAFVDWLFYQRFGRDKDAHRRTWSAAWRWWLTLRGYSDAECDAAALSFAAGENLAWLVRLRGRDVAGVRVDRALAELEAAAGQFVKSKARARVRKRWRAFVPTATVDLAASLTAIRKELGDRKLRVAAMTAIAREAHRRGEPIDRTRERLIVGLVEARCAGVEAFEAALADASRILAQR